MFLESTNLFSYDTYSNEFVDIETNKSKSIKVASSNVIESLRYDPSVGITQIDFNEKKINLNSLNKLLLSFYLNTYYAFDRQTKQYIKYDKINPFIYKKINENIYKAIGVSIEDVNRSEYILNKPLPDYLLYFYRNPQCFLYFLHYLEDISISYGDDDNRHVLNFFTFEHASLFQTLLSLFGYRSYTIFKKETNTFNTVYYHYSGTLVAKIKSFNSIDLPEPELFYNLNLHTKNAKYIITSSNAEINSICYVLPYKEL